MPNKKTSTKQSSSLDDMPTMKLKSGIKFKKFNATKRMKDKKYVFRGLWECIKEGDTEAFKEILKVHLELTNKDKLAKEIGISRRSLFRMLSPEGNPTLETISKVISKIA